jgi:hypothetical protein
MLPIGIAAAESDFRIIGVATRDGCTVLTRMLFSPNEVD